MLRSYRHRTTRSLAALLVLVAAGLWAGEARAQTIEQDSTFVCDRPMSGETVRVTIRQQSGAPPALRLKSGCTGHFRLEGWTEDADGIKGGVGVRDLRITGYMIAAACDGCAGDGLHQDVVQIMGGQRITLDGMYLLGQEINHSSFFVNAGINAQDPPRDITCVGCTILKMRGDGASAVHIGDEAGNGVRDSRVFCNQANCFYKGRGDLGGNSSPSFTDATWDQMVAEAQGSEEPPPPPPPDPDPACSDGIDNDGDGLTDYPADPGCESAEDTDETDPVEEPPPPPGEDPFLDEVQQVEVILHDGKVQMLARIDEVVHGLTGDTACADKVERIDAIVHNGEGATARKNSIHDVVHEPGACEV